MDERSNGSHRSIVRRLLVVCAVLSVLTTALSATDIPPEKPKRVGAAPSAGIEATLEQIAWLVGSWSGEGLGGAVEEHWTKPAGGSMLGMFRLVTRTTGKTRVCELLMIEQEGQRVVYRFRHFGPGHKPWEEPDKPLVFDLIEVSASKAVFESSVQTNPKRLTYRLEGDKLTVHVQGEKAGVLDKGFELSFSRTKLGA